MWKRRLLKGDRRSLCLWAADQRATGPSPLHPRRMPSTHFLHITVPGARTLLGQGSGVCPGQAGSEPRTGRFPGLAPSFCAVSQWWKLRRESALSSQEVRGRRDWAGDVAPKAGGAPCRPGVQLGHVAPPVSASGASWPS